MFDSLRPYGLQPARLLCPWDSPRKNTRVGCHALLQGNLPDPQIEPTPLMSPALAGRVFTTSATWKAHCATTRKKGKTFAQGLLGQSSVTADTGDLGLGVPGLYTYSPDRLWNSHSPGSRETEAAGSEGICPQRGAELRICLKETWFDSWVGKIPRRRAWQPTPVFLPGESHEQRSLVGYTGS